MTKHPLLRRFVRVSYDGKDIFGQLLGVENDGNTARIKISTTRQLYFCDINDVEQATHADEMWSKLKGTVRYG